MAFKVEIKEKMFQPGDPMTRDRFSMGYQLGNDLMILYREHSDITSFEIVDMKTGDTICVTRKEYPDTLDGMFDKVDSIIRAKARYLKENSKEVKGWQE